MVASAGEPCRRKITPGAPACFAQLMVDPAGMLDASFRPSYGVYKIQSFGQAGYHIIWQRDPGVSVDTD
jgi:hypothetical protein